jgi:phenylalanyl-tRNA synthetase beta chain
MECKVLTLSSYGEGGFYEFKGALESIFDFCGADRVTYEADKQNPSYHPGRCAKIFSKGESLGTFGQVHPLVMKNYGLDVPVFAAEISF